MESKEAILPLLHYSSDGEIKNTTKDSFNIAYIIYFILGTGYLLPWNAFITAVDYFQYLYPDRRVDRTFSVVCQLVMLSFLFLVVFCFRKSQAYVCINVGLGLFLAALLVVPLMDVFYIKGQSGLYYGFYVTVGAVGFAGLANSLVQSGIIGCAGELPERYMQAVVSGTAASGVLVSLLRIFTKAVYPQDNNGLRNSAILYFVVAIVVMIVCVVLYNVAHRLPVIKYYSELRTQAASEEKHTGGSLSGPVWQILGRVKWYGVGVTLIYVVTLSIFPGFITEDVHSETLGDWYGILLITGFNVFDLVGKSLTALYLIKNANVAIGGCFSRLMFYPLYLGCLHGPQFFRTEIPVTVLTCILGLTNGYFTSVLMISAPKAVQLQHSETAGILIVLFLVTGLAAGSIVSWFWVI